MAWALRGVDEALAKAQAVRFWVVGEGRRVVQPWRSPPGSALDVGARIEVFGGIAARPNGVLKAGESWFRADGYMDAQQFLDEILSGRRRPYSGSQLGLRLRGPWMPMWPTTAFSRRMVEHQPARPGPEQVQAPAARPAASSRLQDERGRATGRPDERARAVVQARAAGELARRIGEIEAQIEGLEQRRAEPTATPVDEASAASDASPAVSDADIATLTFQLKILRRQLALLPERPTL